MSNQDNMIVGNRPTVELEQLLCEGYFWDGIAEVGEENSTYIFTMGQTEIDKDAALSMLLSRQGIDVSQWRWFGAKWQDKVTEKG